LECHRGDVRTKRNGSGTCASSRFSCEGTGCRWAGRGRIKNQGSASGEAAGTWRRLWPHGQRVSREKEAPKNPSCCIYHSRGETTAVTTRRSIARGTTLVKSRCCYCFACWNGLGDRAPHSQRAVLYHSLSLLSSQLMQFFFCHFLVIIVS